MQHTKAVFRIAGPATAAIVLTLGAAACKRTDAPLSNPPSKQPAPGDKVDNAPAPDNTRREGTNTPNDLPGGAGDGTQRRNDQPGSPGSGNPGGGGGK